MAQPAEISPFGQKEPPLTDHIVNILGRYPDGGQILKELIQNADDAGAREVKFLYDGRSFGRKFLVSEPLQKFQGPALWAFNDAIFKPEDWEGIQNLMRSNKKTDILKVGRFGIGFNSVYHITDLPTIVSGEHIGFLDPHKCYFEKGESGQKYKINPSLLKGDIRDQFKPFQGVFDLDFNEFYNHTLFRFPLRVHPSKLSKTKYTRAKVNKLFESLLEEAPIVLLFMKSVQHISVYERVDNDDQVKCLFKVEIAPEMCNLVNERRQTMLEKAVEQGVTKSSYVVDICLSFESDGEKVYKWLVLNQIGAKGEERIAELSKQLSLLPWVGCAVPLNENAKTENTGRIFCFLPLPRDVDCQTGLPVLVHGAFGVTDNRRGLMWPGSECQNNETAEWNVLLVQSILYSVMYDALKSIILDNPISGLEEIQRRELVYSTVPKISDVVGHWECLLLPLFQGLQQLNMFYAKSSSGTSWITLQEGMLDQMRTIGVAEETKRAVLATLLKNSQVIITDLPEHMSEVIGKYFGERREITPKFLRAFLKDNSVLEDPYDHKLQLLEFVLHDNLYPDELKGVPLLPLASRKFDTFKQHCHNSDPSSSIFVSSGNCTDYLLPNMENRFLDKNIPTGTHEKLVAMATGLVDDVNPTQLINLTPDLVIKCLRSSLPEKWFNSGDVVSWKPGCAGQPPKKWITDIWHWILETFKESLEVFKGFPLIPLKSNSETKLAMLSKQSRFIFNSDSSKNKLPDQVVRLLEAVGCIVLPWSSRSLHVRHPDISSYVASPVPDEVTLLLHRLSMQSAVQYVMTSSKSDRKILQSFFALSQALSKDQKDILQHLPLLDSLKGSCTAALIEGRLLRFVSPEFKLPTGFNFRKGDQIISSAEPESLQLIRLLGLELLKPGDVFRLFLFPDIRAQIYSRQETTEIMLWILERIIEIQNQEFQEEIMELPFVSTRSEELKRPCELYDPNDPVLSQLFIGENSKFPSEEFSKPRMISTLLDLGLCTKNMITASDLFGVAKDVSSSAGDYEDSLKKVQALVTILQEFPNVLQLELAGQTLTLKLAELKWLPRTENWLRETGYPNFMRGKWYTSETLFFRPGELCRESHALLIGSSAPILGIKMDNHLQDILGIKDKVDAKDVIEHLNTAVNVWEEKKKSNSQYTEMLNNIYSHLANVCPQEIVTETIQQKGLTNWVWHGSGFCSPKQIAIEKDVLFEFRPPLFLLPEIFNDGGSLTNFFKTHGVRERFFKEDIILVLAAIKDKHENASSKITSKHLEKDLRFCRSVLEWLVNDLSDGETLSEDLRESVFVPAQSAKDKLVLKKCGECTYCDRECLRHGTSELDITDDYVLIHEDIPTKLAILLGVPSLSSRLLSPETIEFEQTGPYEPITRRISNILKEYKEGVGIFKELIQNADDAGATTVKFLVDWRHGPTDSLFSPDMAECQGPALWAYNDAVFTDKDFENINKLAGGTKVEDLSKIGRFGLGFNAVYHLTDVPSFISRNYLCIFDPNVSHISNHIRNKSQPGIRLNLARNPRPLSAFADQFSLYDEVFGCKTAASSEETFSYPGTLFRFPFRTKNEAKKSEICQTVYNHSKVKQIVRTLQRSASLILLYTQNVKHVELYELSSTEKPQNLGLVLSISKEVPVHASRPGSYIKQCSSWWQQKLSSCSSEEAPSRLEEVKIVQKEMPSTITNTKASIVENYNWLVAYCVGTDVSVELASEEKGQEEGLLPLAGAAALLQSSSSDSATLIPKEVKGEAFCFLPLSISTGLPIHVNSSFAVRSNRDGIWERTTADENLESRWNKCLLQDAIPEAYFRLLAGMVEMSSDGSLLEFSQSFHEFWPRLTTSKASWEILVASFYRKLVERGLKLFCSDEKWMEITKGFIVDEELRQHHDDRVVKTLRYLEQHVFDLPSDVIDSMNKSVTPSVAAVIEKRTLTLVTFFEKFLFPNLSIIPAELRDPIVHHGLRYLIEESREDAKQLEELYKKDECIPCSPDGQKLSRPCDLISSQDESVAVLYSPEENRFPFGELDQSQLFALEKLGMIRDLLPWKEIYGRAKSIEELAVKDKRAALERSRNLITYLRCNLEKLRQKEDLLDSHSLQRIKFLPVCRTPPSSYTLPWKGALLETTEFLSPTDLFLMKDADLIGSSCFIVDDTNTSGCSRLDVNIKYILGFSDRRPNFDQVLQQLKITTESETSTQMKMSVCKRVYKHLNENLDENRDVVVIERLTETPWLFLQGCFVESKKVALEWKDHAIPYLYTVPDNYKRDYDKLLELTRVKIMFRPSDFLEALDSLSQSKDGSCLSPEELKIVVTLTNELAGSLDKTVKKRIGKIPLPDFKGLLCNSEDLTIPESFTLKYVGNERKIHRKITPTIALKLGAIPLSTRRRQRYGGAMSISCVAFGQYEKLTDRIKNILVSYPCDVGILKELVQNADDAKASEIQFIYDKRTLPHKRVLQNNAGKIQGPALCVYNNKHFSEEDFNGICQLGIGSKRDDPEKTGQYGIGFNAVYHLTDCPSFLSDDDTLCILDPHCQYSPEATTEAPGGRYNNIDADFKDVFSDTVKGYLGDFSVRDSFQVCRKFFPLKGSTMFRLPLRTEQQANTSQISPLQVTDLVMTELLRTFQNEAKKLLLFLNHVKKICLWEITEKSKLKLIYSVNSELKGEDEEKLHELHRHLKDNKEVSTFDIPRRDLTYTIRIKDENELQEEWLVHQCFGINAEAMNHEQTPNVCDLGLFPRGGIAALLSSEGNFTEEYVAYSFLPLPIKTSLPVHVNGHFALDGSRRDLWYDDRKTCRKTKWNKFMKTQVLAPAYASLINKARKHIPSCEKDSAKIYFSSEEEATKCLGWYHKLFPEPNKDPKWDILAVEVYQFLKETPFLPVVCQIDVATEKIQRDKTKSNRSPNSKGLRKREEEPSSGFFRNTSGKFSPRKSKHAQVARKSNLDHSKTARHATVTERRDQVRTAVCIREWLSPNSVYFTKEEDRQSQEEEGESHEMLFDTLLRIHMPVLLYTPSWIHRALSESGVESQMVAPGNVVEFLLTSQNEGSKCDIGKVPIQLSKSNIQNLPNLECILRYCKKELQDSPKNLNGLPLLLTADSVLRVFSSENPVYCSFFDNLFPDKPFRFVHPNLVRLLSTFCVIQSDQSDSVIRNLTIQSCAAEFMPDVFNQVLPLGERKHVPWDYPKEGVLSKNWFSILWEFLKSDIDFERDKSSGHKEYLSAASAEDNDTNSLVKFLGNYPIIPTKNGKLATVKYAKTVLAVTAGKAGNFLQDQVTKILKDIACPFLDESIAEKALSVVLSLVADPHIVSDVLHVLNYMNSTGTLDATKFHDNEIRSLLRFFEEDCKKEESMNNAKTLPFYKGVDGTYHSLSSCKSCIRVPAGLPHDGVKELQLVLERKILFLPDAFYLKQLYKALGVEVDCKISTFYINYVLPSFSSLSSECQIKFLRFIKDDLYLSQDATLISELKSTRCIPDLTGDLNIASSYFNPQNELFKVMFKPDSNVFPKSPFNEKHWIEFLTRLGLKKNCDAEQFIKFAKHVEEPECNKPEYNNDIVAQSKALVKYLIGPERGKKWSFEVISKIKFIVPEEVENALSSLHPQYRVSGKLELVSYRNSVPWEKRNLVWTSANLLPSWAYPDNYHLVSSLRISTTPALEIVFEHIKIMSKRALEMCMSNSLSEKLVEVFVDIYKFLQNQMNCVARGPPSSCCNDECHKIGACLTPVACLLLTKEQRLVKGEEMSFESKEEEKLKPHFYAVPGEYYVFEHLLKRLGVTQKITASQMANVLNSIKNSCEKETMSSEEDEKARYTTSVFFESLRRDENEIESRLSNCEALHLPSMSKRLVESKNLICKMQPRLRESVSKLGHEVLCPLEKCGLKRELENDYLEALPKRFRPSPLSSLVREELEPFCKMHMTCSDCTVMNCPFIEKFIFVLRSSQFQRGILRLLKHQKNTTTLKEEDKKRAARFSSTKSTVIKCMNQVKIHLVDVAKGESLPQSSMERTCFAEKKGTSWTLYIQHKFGGLKSQAILAKAVNEIMDGCLGEKIAELCDMLSCDWPSQISDVLNKHNVAIDYSEESEELGQPVPRVCHYLMIQNPLCVFEEGTRVAYGVDQIYGKDWNENSQEKESTKYTLAKILVRANETDKAAAEYDFNAQYKIDLGSKTETVSVLDIYSYHQDDMGNLVSKDDDENGVDLDVQKRNITRALTLAKKLKSMMLRRKVLGRLFLHWLRCKDSEVAAELTELIESEVIRLEVLVEEEFRSFSGHWRRRERQESIVFSSYSRWIFSDSGGTNGSRVYSLSDAMDYVYPDADEAKRWIKQSKADLDVAKMLWPKSYSQVCHMSQQCVEKCLKGVLYAKCGIPSRELRTHDISRLKSRVSSLKGAPSELDRAGKVKDYYLSTRYPDNQPKYRVPAEEFNEKQAKEALEVADTVYKALAKFAHDS